MDEVLQQLDAVIAERRGGDASRSYVARLLNGGMDGILKKVGEECAEAIVAAKNAEFGGEREALVRETADLWFHSLLMLAKADLSSADVLRELERRFGVSGIAEKASRTRQSPAQS